jgi:hypothetical protein
MNIKDELFDEYMSMGDKKCTGKASCKAIWNIAWDAALRHGGAPAECTAKAKKNVSCSQCGSTDIIIVNSRVVCSHCRPNTLKRARQHDT